MSEVSPIAAGRPDPSASFRWGDGERVVEVRCDGCGVSYVDYRIRVEKARRHYCTAECYRANRSGDKNPKWRGGLVSAACAGCGTSIEILLCKVDGARRYCSNDCRVKHQRGAAAPTWRGGEIERTCEACGGVFVVRFSKAETSRFCSARCTGIGQRVYPNPKIRTREKTHRRRIRESAAKLAAPAHTWEQWEDIMRRAKFRCVKCGKKKVLTRDHIIPLSKGGTDDITNIQPLCRPCNSRKHANVETLL